MGWHSARGKIKSRRALPIALLTLAAAGATADRIITVYGNGGKALFSAAAANADSIVYGTTGKMFRIYSPARRQLFSTLRARVDSVVFSNDHSSFPRLKTSGGYNDVTIAYDGATQEYTITGTGGDPYFVTEDLDADLPDDSCMLTFEYSSPQTIMPLQVFFAEPTTEARSAQAGELAATAGGWATLSFPIATYRSLYGWGKKGDHLRIDLGSSPGFTVRIRDFHILSMSSDDRRSQEARDSIQRVNEAMAARISAYLDTDYASKITDVTVTRTTVSVSGSCSGEGSFAIADIAPYEDVTEEDTFEITQAIPDSAKGGFTLTLPRRLRRATVASYDRALSKWAIVRTDGGSHVLASHARYADSITPTRSAAKVEFKGRKGIAAGLGSTYISDFDSLDAHSITQNIALNSFFSNVSWGSYTDLYRYGGRNYFVNTGALANLEAVLSAAARRGMVVEAIILTPSNSAFKDPECTGGYYSMPNMTTPEAVNFYAAALDYLAKRYTSGTYGRIHHWIMHNEVDAGEVWTNMGKQPEPRYNDRYVKSLRLCYNIIRQYDQNASVLASFTSRWNEPGDDFSPRNMLEQTLKYSAAEGDFRWGIAYHPYPTSNPADFWNHDHSATTFDNDTRHITFYNPEVINAWILDPAHFYKGGTKRLLVFSEQGSNSPTYSDRDLAVQAAGAAWIWKKLEQLPGIDAMQWHNWADNRSEGGLRIGLRAFEDGRFKSLDRKPVWFVWQAAGSDREDEVFQPYLNTIGISSWDGIVKTVK